MLERGVLSSSASPIIDWAAMERECETGQYTYIHTNLVEMLECAQRTVNNFCSNHDTTQICGSASTEHTGAETDLSEALQVLYNINNNHYNSNNNTYNNGCSGIVKVQAPMVRYSRSAFRQLCRSWGTDINYTHMMIAENFIASAAARQAEFARYVNETKLVLQFAAKSGPTMATAAELVALHCDGVDINCGCPQRWAMESGYGSALLNKVEDVADMIKCVRNNVTLSPMCTNTPFNSFPCSVKMRLLCSTKHNKKTLEESSISAVDVARSVDFARQCASAGADWITVHGRTPYYSSNAPVEYDVIRLIQESVTIPVIANGAIQSPETAVQTALKCHVGSVMVGNGLLDNPACLYTTHTINNNYSSYQSERLTYQLPHWKRWQNMEECSKTSNVFSGEYINDSVLKYNNNKNKNNQQVCSVSQENTEETKTEPGIGTRKCNRLHVVGNEYNNVEHDTREQGSCITSLTPCEVISDFIRAAIVTNLNPTTTVQHMVRMARHYLTHAQRVKLGNLKNNSDVLQMLCELEMYTSNGHLYTDINFDSNEVKELVALKKILDYFEAFIRNGVHNLQSVFSDKL